MADARFARVDVGGRSDGLVDTPYPVGERAAPNWRTDAQRDGLYAAGGTEEWVAQLVGAFVRAKKARTVLETGTFMGTTSMEIAEAMEEGGTLKLVEMDAFRMKHTQELLGMYGMRSKLNVEFYQADVLEVLKALPKKSIDVAFVDDDHSFEHVEQELSILEDKMAKGGVVLMHDVIGPFGLDDLVEAWEGVIIKTPLLHAGGGLGVLSCY